VVNQFRHPVYPRRKQPFAFGDPAAMPSPGKEGLGQWLCVPPFRSGLHFSGSSVQTDSPLKDTAILMPTLGERLKIEFN
jgi:hypothetical protein